MTEMNHEEGIEAELRQLLNKYSAESVSGTPDFILAKFLIETLKTYNEAVSARAEWRGELVDFRPSPVVRPNPQDGHLHVAVQHRDGKPPWCNECGLTQSFTIPKSVFRKEN